MKEIIVYTFLIFFLCSFIGYFIEVFWVYLNTKKFVNRGFLCGPYIPIYGIGALLILLCLMRYYNDPVVVFIVGIVITSALEYFISFLLEKVFHNKWWDYSDRPYNLNGRVCLRNSILFGILALFIIYFLAPLIFLLFSLFPFKVWKIVALVLFIIFMLDSIYSFIIAFNLRNRIIIAEELNEEKINKIPIIFEKRIKESIANFKAFPNRLLKAFPNIEREYHKTFEIMKNYKEQTKIEKKKNKNK